MNLERSLLQMESDTRKFINFDLDTNLMKTYNLSRYYVYSNIKTFMEKNNFDHVQYSGYESKEPLIDVKVINLLEKMKFDLPWISPLVKDIVITEIKQQHRYNYMFEEEKDKSIEILNVISKSKRTPTTTLMHAFNELNTKTGKINTLKDVKDMYDNLEKYSDEEKNIVNKIVNECKRQETIEQKRQEYLGLSKNVDIEED